MTRGRSLLTFGLIACCLAAEPAQAKRPAVRIAIANLASWIEPATLEAAARPLINAIAARARLTYSLQVGISGPELATRLRANELNAAFGSVAEYLALSSGSLKLTPLVRAVSAGSSASALILLAPVGGVTRPEQLRGKVVSIFTQDAGQRLFLEVALARAGLSDPARQVSVQAKKDAKSPVLDVLFGEAAACVASEPSFAAMAELNPQLRQRLRAIARSEPLANPPLFARVDAGGPVLRAMREGACSLHQDPRGRQLLLMFRAQRMVPAADSDYDPHRRLLKEHARLLGGKR